MMNRLLFIFCLFFGVYVTAQDTVVIQWTFGSNSNVTPQDSPRNADRTIEVGDTVRWEFIENGAHNVVSSTGSQETFSSGGLQTAGFVFEYTFTEVGSNPYVCTPHFTGMFGVITVVPEGSLSMVDFTTQLMFTIKPNPSRHFLNINLENESSGDFNVEVYDVLGKQVYKQRLSRLETSIDVLNWKSGIYLVKVFNDTQSQTKRFLKQ